MKHKPTCCNIMCFTEKLQMERKLLEGPMGYKLNGAKSKDGTRRCKPPLKSIKVDPMDYYALSAYAYKRRITMKAAVHELVSALNGGC